MTIRRIPEDFVVEELPSLATTEALRSAWAAGSTHAVYELTKVSLTTPEGVQRLAKALGFKWGEVDYAGLKDKHAKTTQWVSLPVPKAPARPLLERASTPGMDARLLGWLATPLSAETISGNRFTIVVRDLTPQSVGEMRRRARTLSTDPTWKGEGAGRLVFVNYFGDQRFASARHVKGFAAPHLVKGEFEAALRLLIATPARKDSGKIRSFTRLAATHWGEWSKLLEVLPHCPERAAIEALVASHTRGDYRAAFQALPYLTQQMAVEAFQSHLWNRAAHAMVVQGAICGVGPKAGVLHADDDFGEMLFPPGAGLKEGWQTIEMPMVSPETNLRGVWSNALGGVLRDAGLTLGALTIPGVRRPTFGSAQRPVFAEAKAFEIGTATADDLGRAGRLKVTLRFELPRGAYATVLLRALGQ